MDMDAILDHAAALDAVLILRPHEGDGTPAISWGDAFVYYAPDGVIPPTQPFATIVTKDYPDEPASGLDEDAAFRLNIATSKAEFERVIGASPRDAAGVERDLRARDTWFPHPVYGGAGWLSVVNPDARASEALDLLDAAHAAARDRHARRATP